MALIKHGDLVEDLYASVGDGDELPAQGAVLVSLERWQNDRAALLDRADAVGVRLHSDQSPELIADDLKHISLVALEFPAFRDGRAYSYSRMLRERFGFKGEVRAVGDVLMEQLHFMLRTGFDAFEFESDDPVGQFKTAMADFTVWYQPSSDSQPTATQLRHSLRR